ncbi:MAG TPA: agmatine deiminase family protein [Candidatus Binataceae bacterium]|jgi:agmatine deiminase|nr:agmatine deiminase family protein [Candidatus Binataceae bacterium]
MPAEWEPHRATYLVWPHNRDTWPGKFDAIAPVFARMAAAIASFEPLRLVVRDEEMAQLAREMLLGAADAAPEVAPGELLRRIEFAVVPTNDSWVRDYGPIFVNRIAGGGAPAQIALDFSFNSWGKKYGAFDLDDAVPRRLGERYGFEVIEPGLVLEGGSIDVDGAGTALTTESCLLNPNRNPGLDRTELEERLKYWLGVRAVLWLGAGIAGDDTDGHVDDLARFVAPGTVVTVIEDDPHDANYPALAENLHRLRAMCDADGRPLKVETLPMPPALYYEGTRLPASYANFYILNGGVLMPTFGCAEDATAAATLERLFPGRRVVGIPSRDLVWGLGAIHCLTQQHPLPPE